jgi:hypothetical protein
MTMTGRGITAIVGAVLAISSVAWAQTGGALPLASVGNQISWASQGEEMRIVVPAGSDVPLQLELYSPGLNLNDYVNGRATTGYYGDEIYGRNLPFSTVFTLTNAQNAKFLERRYDTTERHAWERVLNTRLAPGTYTLKSVSSGNGKNAFAVRVNAPYQVQATRFTVNARGTPGTDLLAARIVVPSELIGKKLDITNFDADGNSELELYAVSPDGVRRRLRSSPNNAAFTDSFDVTERLAGEWSIFARIVATTKQFSNAFNLRVRSGQEPVFANLPAFSTPAGTRLLEPPVVEVVDPQGRPIPGASYTITGEDEYTAAPVLPTGYQPVSATVLEGQGTVVSPSQTRTQPGPSRVRFVARQIQGALEVTTVALIGNSRVPITGIPFTAAGQTMKSPMTIPLSPGEYPVRPTPLPGSSVEGRSATVTDNQTARVVLEYRVNVALKLEIAPNVVSTCAQSLLTATATTEFPYAIPANVKLTLPRGMTSQAPLEGKADLSAGKPGLVAAPVRVCESGTVRATLDPSGIFTEGSIRVLPPAGVTVSRVTDVQKGPVRVVKSYQQDNLGYIVTLSITVERAVENLRVIDALPTGGATPAVRRPTQTVTGLVNNQTVAVNWRLDGNTFNLGRLSPGVYTVQYGIFTDLPADSVVTVPDVLWEETSR